jgi:hypothetical protein
MTEEPRIEVAQIVTRFIAGAGGVALRGALHLDRDRYRVTIVTGEGGPLTELAEQAGMEVVIEPSLVSPLSPGDDLTALRRLTRICTDRRFDVVHTHSAHAGVDVSRELVVVPSTTRAIASFDDTGSAVHHFWESVAAVPPGLTRSAGPATVALRLARAMPWAWTGALAPGRVVVGTRR